MGLNRRLYLTSLLWRGFAGALIGIAFAQAGHAGPHDEIPGHVADLPPEGRSNFDHLVHRLGGKLPFPFDNLIDTLQNRDNIDVVRTLFPHGRSLQRHLTDFDAPRDLITVRPLSDAPIQNPKELFDHLPNTDLYIGYSPRANTLEVISMNRKLGRFEFQIVHDYGPGLVPKISYAPRALCESCHQGGGPIFSVGGWSESEGKPHNLSKIQAGKYYQTARIHFGKDAATDRIAKAAWASVRNGAPAFDDVAQPSAHRGGNFQELWVRGCGSDPVTGPECRRLMLEVMIGANVHSGPFSQSLPTEQLTRLREILSHSWPKEGISFYPANISNRDLDLFPPDQPLPADRDPLTPREPEILTFEKLERGGTPISETNTKPLYWIGSYISGFRENIGERESHYLYSLAGKDMSKLSAVLKSDRVKGSLGHQPLDQDMLLKNMLQEMGVAVPEVLPRDLAEKKMSAPVLETNFEGTVLKPLRQPEFKTLSHFKKYCGDCHRSGDLPFGFMKGTDEQILAQMREPATFAKIIERLQPEPDQRMMPPPSSRQGKDFRRELHLRDEMSKDLSGYFKDKGCNPLPELIRSLQSL